MIYQQSNYLCLKRTTHLIYKHRSRTNNTNLERHWHSLFHLRWIKNQTASFTKNQERPIACVRIPISWSSLCLTNKDRDEGYLSAYLLWWGRFSSLWQTKGLNALSIVPILFVLKRESPCNAGDNCYADNKLKIMMVGMDKMVAVTIMMTRIE